MFFPPPPVPPALSTEEPAHCLTPAWELVSSHLYGGQLSLEISANGTRAFVADGAVLSIRDLTSQPPMAPIAQVPLPDCQALAQLHYVHPADGKEYLFLAGGAHGLWRLPLSTASYVPERVLELVGHGGLYSWSGDGWDGSGKFQRKRCVDVAVLEAPAGGNGDPVLLALFAASSDPDHSFLGPSELWAFRLSGTSVLILDRFEFPGTDPTGTPPEKETLGTSLAVDPANPDSVWVGMGKGGLWRADLDSGGSLAGVQMPFPWEGQSPAVGTDYVCDIAIVRSASASRSFLYAGLNFIHPFLPTPQLKGSIVEYDLSTDPPTRTQRIVTECSRVMRIAAATDDDGQNVRVAVAEHPHSILHADTAAPHFNNGIWTDICLASGAYDPDGDFTGPSSQAIDCKRIELYQHALASTGPQPPLQPVTAPELPALLHGTWGSLVLRHVSGSDYRLFSCTSERGTYVWDLDWTTTCSASQIVEYKGIPSIGAQKAVVSELNPEILHFGLEGGSAAGILATAVHIDGASPFEISPIMGTAPPAVALGCSVVEGCHPYQTSGHHAAILGSAQCVLPGSTTVEFFFPAVRMAQRITTNAIGNCICTQEVGECDPGWDDPYGQNHSWTDTDFEGVTPDPLRCGWRVVQYNVTPFGSGLPVLGDLAVQWLQLQAPRGITEQQSAPASDLGYSLMDPRLREDEWPVAMIGIRPSSSHGVKIFDVEELATNQGCSGIGNRGFGEHFTPENTAQTLTHYEIEYVNGSLATNCEVSVTCGDVSASPSAKRLFNQCATVYSVVSPRGVKKHLLVVAVGFSTGAQIPQLPTCGFAPYQYHPMVDIFDVTALSGGITDPPIQRIAIGTESPGHSFDVAVKSVGEGSGATHYLYVADVLGNLLVFDVSYSILFESPSQASAPYLESTPFLTPILTASRRFPRDAHDGLLQNVIDVEIEGSILYCAMGRAGVALVDISEPTNPRLCSVIETPGMALGIAFRTVGSHRQMIIGDSRCGIRVYSW